MSAAQIDNVYLLLCIPFHRHGTICVHMNLDKVQSDQIFFTTLRSHYHTMRGRCFSFFSLKRLISIRFVQFEMYKSELADIRKVDDIPPEDKKDYDYLPRPAELIPPVGPNHMMHLYEHPDHAEDEATCLGKVPKKLREKLQLCPNRGTGLGWGVHFVEGLHWVKVWAFGFVGLLASALFGVVWSVLRDDVQGGFGITACLMVVLTFSVGVLQSALEPR